MTTWSYQKLGKMAGFKNGLNYSKENFGKGIKVIGVSDFQNFNYPKYSLLDEINPNGIVRDEDLLSEGDFLFVRSNGNRDLIGRCLYIKDLIEPVSHSGFTIRARFFLCNIEKRFYLYYFKSDILKKTLSLYGGGTNINNLNQGILSNLDVPVPPIPIQRKIAAILSTYDDLIENNNRRIAILEKMAEELYKEWFVRLRFPGYEKVKIVKGVPEGCEVKRIGEIIEYYIGGGWGEENQDINHVIGAYVIRGTDIPDLKSGRFKNPPFRFHKVSNYESRAMKKGDIVFEVSGGSKGQLLGRTLLITKGIYELCNGTLICASFCKLIRPSISPFFLSYYLQAYHNCGLVGTYQIQSTGISNYQFESFIKYQTIIVPPKPILSMFDSIVSRFISEKDILSTKNRLLTDSRDRLLSRLMSGKLDVENLDICFPPGMEEEVPSSPGPFSPWEKGRGKKNYEENS